MTRTPQSSPDVTITLTLADRRAIARFGHGVARHNLVTDPEAFVREAQIAAGGLSRELRASLIDFSRFGNPAGGLRLRGLPIGRIPATPDHADFAIGASLVAAARMAVPLAVLGEQFGFAPELGGNLVQDILPVRGFERTQQSIGATVDLDTHVEMAFLPERCDYVCLLCLRSDHDRVALTTLSSSEAMLRLLDADTVRVLRQPRFKTTVDESFLRGDGLKGPIWISPICAISGPPERARLRVDFAETRGLDAEAQCALDALFEASKRAAVGIALEPGDLLVIDNRRAFHGRTSFEPRYDGADRWLLRSFITKDLGRSEDVRNGDGRVVAPSYASQRPDLAAAA